MFVYFNNGKSLSIVACLCFSKFVFILICEYYTQYAAE